MLSMKFSDRTEETRVWAQNSLCVAVTGITSGGAERIDRRAARRIERAPGLPSSRAVVGALLMALAAVGTFLAYAGSTSSHGRDYVVAARSLPPGTRITAADLDAISLDLPAALSKHAFTDARSLVGKVAVGPVAKGEVIQAGSLTTQSAATEYHELSFSLPKSKAVDGRLQIGDLIDVFVTYDQQTRSVVRNAEILSTGESRGSLGNVADITLTLAIPSDADVVALVHAIQAGKITVVRSTFANSDDALLTFDQQRATGAGKAPG
jgi:Flp pilus assembly protein CpaB